MQSKHFADGTERSIAVTYWLILLLIRLFTQPFIKAQIEENLKAPRHWPLWGEFTGDRWIPHTKGQ